MIASVYIPIWEDKMEPIRVMLVDNEEVFREGLTKLLQTQPHIKVVYQCGTGMEAIEKSRQIKPDIILIDSQVTSCNAKEAVEEIVKVSPEIKVAIIARPGIEATPLNVMKSGAKAYLSKSISSSDLIKSVELISSGRIIISDLFAKRFLDEISITTETRGEKDEKTETIISQREMEIIELIAEGATNKEIANKLYIAENTVKVHVKNILKKLELRNRQQLVAYAVLKNWVAVNTKNEENVSSSET